jgi:hypothetical protein
VYVITTNKHTKLSYSTADARMYCLVSARIQIKWSIEYGHIAHTSLIYVWYAWVGCAMNRNVPPALLSFVVSVSLEPLIRVTLTVDRWKKRMRGAHLAST